ncbi:MAG: hypothetical protein AAB395_01720 [Patescibacteria group bacterium]
MAEVNNKFPDRDDGPVDTSEWEVLLREYRLARDAYISSTRRLWLLPTPIKANQAYETNEELADIFESIAMHIICSDDGEITLEERVQLVASLGRMCDEDTVDGLNNIIGYDKLETIFGVDSEEVYFVPEEASPEEIESGAEDYVEFIREKLENDLEEFFSMPHFKKMRTINTLRSLTYDVAKIGSAVTIGILLAEKLRDRRSKQSNAQSKD